MIDSLIAHWDAACAAIDSPAGQLPSIAIFVIIAVLVFRRDAARHLRRHA